MYLTYMFKFECLVLLCVDIWFCVIDDLLCQDLGLQNEDYWDRQNVSKSSVITSVSSTKKGGKNLSLISKCHEKCLP